MIPDDAQVFYWTRYDVATGRILSAGGTTVLEDVPEATGDVALLDGQFHGDTHYVNTATGAVVPRPALAVADQTYDITVGQELVLNVPVGTQVERNYRVIGTVDDGTLEILGEQPTSYSLRLLPPFPYRDCRIKVNVT